MCTSRVIPEFFFVPSLQTGLSDGLYFIPTRLEHLPATTHQTKYFGERNNESTWHEEQRSLGIAEVMSTIGIVSHLYGNNRKRKHNNEGETTLTSRLYTAPNAIYED